MSTKSVPKVRKPADISKGSSEIADRLKDIQLLKMETGEMKRLGDYWESSSSSTYHRDPNRVGGSAVGSSQGPVILVFLRRWGCAVCRMMAAHWNMLKPNLDKAGIRLVGIGVEKAGYEEFVAGGYFDGELLVDERKESYSALGCGETSWRSLWGLLDGQIPRMIKLSQKRGFPNNFSGDTNQLGGTFAVAPGGKLLYGHYQSSTDFEVNMTILFNSLNLHPPHNFAELAELCTQQWTANQLELKQLQQQRKEKKESSGSFSRDESEPSSPPAQASQTSTTSVTISEIQRKQQETMCCDSSSPARRLGQKLGFVSHVRCEKLAGVVAKLTSHSTTLPPPELLKTILKHSQEDNPCSPLTLAERNTLMASEMGKRLQTVCFEQGLKALLVVHTFMMKGHVSFREAISQDPALLNLDKASDSLWVLCVKAKLFSGFIKKYGSYLNDLANFFYLAQPFDPYAKPTVTTTTIKEEKIPAEGGQPVTEERTVVTTTPSDRDLKHARKSFSDKELANLVSAAIALFKSAYALTPDENIASNPVSREMVRLVYSDIKLFYSFLTETFSHQVRHKLKGRVEDIERGLRLYDQYETACAEVSIFFATAASYNIITSTPKLKPVPRSSFAKMSKIVQNAKSSGIEYINFEEVDENTIERDSLANVLAAADSADSFAGTSEDTVGSPGGTSAATPKTEAAGRANEAKLTPATAGGNINWEEDSLADLRSASYGQADLSKGGVLTVDPNSPNTPGSSLDNSKALEDESEDIKALLTSGNAPAIMVAASENSASAARRFHLLKDDVLGKGGFGTVYKAWDKQEGMYAAVKEMTVDTQKTNLQELFGEFRTATDVRHENIVKTLMFSLSDSTGSIFMEWLPAGSLHQVLSQTKAPFGEHLIRRYIRDALSGLDYLHKRNIVHRDIKLSNMLLSVGGKVKLTDFGSSKVLSMINDSMKTETIVGTVPYMSPESVRGTYSAASDIWAIGCSIIEMLTAKHPWAERGEKDQIAMIFHIGSLQSPNHIPSYGAAAERISDELRSFIEMCFVFDYHSRPSAEKLLQHPFLLMEEDN